MKAFGCNKCPVDEWGCDAQYRGSRCFELRAVAIETLQAQLVQMTKERDAAVSKIEAAYEIAWGCDIPSPTVPEYVELHSGMTRVMEALRGPGKEQE